MSTTAIQSRIDSIMIVEPAARVRASLEVALRQGDYRLFMPECKRDSDLRQIVEIEAPDMVLISFNLSLGGSSGLDLCRLLIKEHLAPAVVMTSSEPTKQQVLESVRAGAMGFVVTPPFSSQQLSKKLESVYSQTPEAESRSKFPIIYFGSKELSAAQKVDIITRDASTIRAMSFAVSKILHTVSQDDSGANDIAKAAESDPAIAAMILKRANSSYYGGAEAATDLRSAVVRMGFRECRDQVVGMSVSGLFPRLEKSFGFNRVWYWLHSLATAILAQDLSTRCSFEGKEQCFTMGLLHDIGKIIMDDFLNREYRGVVRMANTNGISMLAAERETLERDHAAVGSKVLAKWQFPQAIHETIGRLHNNDELLNEVAPSVAGAVFLADQMAKATLVGCGGDFIVPEIPDDMWTRYGYLALSKEAIIEKLYCQMQEFSEFLQINDHDVEMALEHGSGTGTAVIIDPQDSHNWLLSFFLVNQGFNVEKMPDVGTVQQRNEPPTLCVLRPADVGGAIVALDQLEQSPAGLCPTLCLAASAFPQDTLSSRSDWLRVLDLPMDCFVLLCHIRELLPDHLRPTILEEELGRNRG